MSNKDNFVVTIWRSNSIRTPFVLFDVGPNWTFRSTRDLITSSHRIFSLTCLKCVTQLVRIILSVFPSHVLTLHRVQSTRGRVGQKGASGGRVGQSGAEWNQVFDDFDSESTHSNLTPDIICLLRIIRSLNCQYQSKQCDNSL